MTQLFLVVFDKDSATDLFFLIYFPCCCPRADERVFVQQSELTTKSMLFRCYA